MLVETVPCSKHLQKVFTLRFNDDLVPDEIERLVFAGTFASVS